jgi:hypothetical protein
VVDGAKCSRILTHQPVNQNCTSSLNPRPTALAGERLIRSLDKSAGGIYFPGEGTQPSAKSSNLTMEHRRKPMKCTRPLHFSQKLSMLKEYFTDLHARAVPLVSLMLMLLVLPVLAMVTAQAATSRGRSTSPTQVRAYLVQKHHSVQTLLKFMDETSFPENELYGPFHPIELFSSRTTDLRWTVRIPMNVSVGGTGKLTVQPETQAPPQPTTPPSTSSPSSGETVTITQTQTYNGQQWTTTATWEYQTSSGFLGGGSWVLVSWSAVLDSIPSPHHGGTQAQ